MMNWLKTRLVTHSPLLHVSLTVFLALVVVIWALLLLGTPLVANMVGAWLGVAAAVAVLVGSIGWGVMPVAIVTVKPEAYGAKETKLLWEGTQISLESKDHPVQFRIYFRRKGIYEVYLDGKDKNHKPLEVNFQDYAVPHVVFPRPPSTTEEKK